MNYCISIGKSRFDRVWHNEAWPWERLRDRLAQPVVTSETMSDYRAMSRDRQTAIKDVGGFVGGYLTGGKRSASAVTGRSVVTLDYDDFDEERLKKMRVALAGRLWVIHSTHKHRDDAWRVRLVIAADRNMTADEYGAVARRLAERCGTDGLDRSTFEPCRLMFWPSRSKDGPWLFEEGKGTPFSVDEVLASYEDWTDMSSWPLLDDETAGLLAEGTAGGAAGAFRDTGRFGKQEDPRSKKGLVGVFCRAYDINAAIARFLPDVYSPGRSGRYTHTGSTTSGGAWVLDDARFLYSFHGTDPVQGRLLNSWDLVRLHKFGEADRSKGDGTRADRLPSMKMMEDFAMTDTMVKRLLVKERQEQVAADFAGFDLADGEPAGGEERGQTPEEVEWEMASDELPWRKDGTLPTTISNCVTVIDKHPRLTGTLRLNDFSGNIDVVGRLPWRRGSKTWTNTDDACLRGFLDRGFGLSGKEKISDALKNVANAHGYHPVREYLQSLKWDGVRRVEFLFTDVLGAEKTPLNRELARLFFKAACRRIWNPGEKFDYFMILQGPEGCGKSSLFAMMGGEWFSDSVVSIEGKEGMESVQGRWIIEIGELIGVKKSAVESVKSFISREVDQYRPAYGTVTESRPRQCVLVGTTNEEHFLRGINTGNRRQPVVEILPELRTVDQPVREYVAQWRDQLWAEAMELHKEGGPLMLPDELEPEVRKIQDRHNLDKSNPLFPEVARFLDFHLPEQWEKWGLQERLAWLHGAGQNEPTEPGPGRKLRETVTVPEVLQELFEMKRTDKEYLARSREIGQFLNSLKGEWEMVGNMRTKGYGVQKTWKRMKKCVTEASVTPADDFLSDF